MKPPALALIAALALSAVACAPAEPAAPEAAIDSQRACVAAGGDWRRDGRAQMFRCVIAYSDAGAPCADATDCQGECRLPEPHMGQTPVEPAQGLVTGRCQADSSPFGCFTRVENGRATATLCVD